MLIGQKNLNDQVYLIAEAGNNHEGDFQKALELVDAAAESGADAIKFQTIIPESLVATSETKRIEQLKKFQLSMDQYLQLKNRADQKKLHFLSTPFAMEVIEPLNPMVHAFKISSGDLTWHDFIKKIASKGKPVFLSTGGATLNEVEEAVNAYEIGKGNHPSQLVVLHCVMAYPAPADSLNLNTLLQYKSLFKYIGYSDHYLGLQSCITAAALGARVIEKHFTLNKNTSDFRDHQLSADPEELKLLSKTIKELFPMLGNSHKSLQACEKEIVKVARRSPKATRHIEANSTLTSNDIKVLRPNSGLEAYENCIGRKIKTNLSPGQDII